MKMYLHSVKDRAFTLIELLIVVAIIAILAAIAVPNFLEAQVRSKVSRCKADMRTVATGLESYRIDNNRYPPSAVEAPFAAGPISFTDAGYAATVYVLLSTPISYLSSYPQDCFNPSGTEADPVFDPRGTRRLLDYRRVQLAPATFGQPGQTLLESTVASNPGGADSSFDQWIVYSLGPDREQNINTGQSSLSGSPVAVPGFGDPLGTWPYYDPTNGTISVGDIVRSSLGGDETALVGK